jgi:hypothetical protein
MSSDEVRLHRSVSLDQMAEFDPNTGLWHSDGTFEVVRFHEVLPTDGRENVTHIALPAAKHAALMRVVEAARSLAPLDPMRSNRRVLRVSLESICALRDSLSAYRALTATAPERQGEAPR